MQKPSDTILSKLKPFLRRNAAKGNVSLDKIERLDRRLIVLSRIGVQFDPAQQQVISFIGKESDKSAKESRNRSLIELPVPYKEELVSDGRGLFPRQHGQWNSIRTKGVYKVGSYGLVAVRVNRQHRVLQVSSQIKELSHIDSLFEIRKQEYFNKQAVTSGRS